MPYLSALGIQQFDIPEKILSKIIQKAENKGQNEYNLIYNFSESLFEIFDELAETEQQELLPLLLEISVAYNWQNRLFSLISIEAINEQHYCLLAALFYRELNKDKLSELKNRSEWIEDFFLREKVKLTCDIFLYSIDKDYSVLDNLYKVYFDLIGHIAPSNYSRDILTVLKSKIIYLSSISFTEEYLRTKELFKSIIDLKGDLFLLSSIYNIEAVDDIKVGRYREAIDKLKQAKKITKSIGNRSDSVMIAHNLAIAKSALGKTDEARIALLNALVDADSISLQQLIFYNLADLSLFSGHYDEAEEYLNKCNEIETKLGVAEADTFSLFALLKIHQKDKDKALFYLEKSKTIIERTSIQYSLTLYYYVSGLYFLRMEEDILAAKTELEKSLNTALSNRIFEYILKNEIQLTAINIEQYAQKRDVMHYSKILYHLENLKVLSKEQEIPSIEIEVQLLLYAIYSLEGKTEEAESALSKAITITEWEDLEYYRELVSTISKNENQIITSSLSRIQKLKFSETSKEVKSFIEGIVLVNIDTGLTVYERTLSSVSSFAFIASSLISALKLKEEYITEKESILSLIELENRIFIIETIENILVILITDQDTLTARAKLHIAANRIRYEVGYEVLNANTHTGRYLKSRKLDEIIEEIFPFL